MIKLIATVVLAGILSVGCHGGPLPPEKEYPSNHIHSRFRISGSDSRGVVTCIECDIKWRKFDLYFTHSEILNYFLEEINKLNDAISPKTDAEQSSPQTRKPPLKQP